MDGQNTGADPSAPPANQQAVGVQEITGKVPLESLGGITLTGAEQGNQNVDLNDPANAPQGHAEPAFDQHSHMVQTAPSREDYLREQALHMAIQHSMEGCQSFNVIEHANAFLAFLKGGDKSE